MELSRVVEKLVKRNSKLKLRVSGSREGDKPIREKKGVGVVVVMWLELIFLNGGIKVGCAAGFASFQVISRPRSSSGAQAKIRRRARC